MGFELNLAEFLHWLNLAGLLHWSNLAKFLHWLNLAEFLTEKQLSYIATNEVHKSCTSRAIERHSFGLSHE